MSTGAFLEFLTRLGCRDAGFRGLLAARLKCWSENGNPAFHGIVKLRLRKPSNAPQGQRIGGYGSSLGFHKNHPNLSNYDFSANLLVGAWRRRGCRLKRLLRRWGPGGKRSRDTPLPPPPHPPPAFRGRKEEGFHPLRLRQPSNTPPKVGGPCIHP